VAWAADVPGSPDKYVALFNTRDPRPDEATGRVPLEFAGLGLATSCRVRDLWQQKDLGEFRGEFAAELKPHGAGLYRIAAADVNASPPHRSQSRRDKN
jgi:alpha-galactosidase